MPEDYKKVVLDYYEEKINDGSLSSRLLDPTPGSIREYCIFTYRQRSSSDDDEIIKSFFGDSRQECLGLLENSFAVKFRQLPKILKRKVESPGYKYIELIAWFIDFKPRPSTSYYRSFYTEADVIVRSEETVSTDHQLPEELFVNSAFVNEDSNIPKNTLVNEYHVGSEEGDERGASDNQITGKAPTIVNTNDRDDNNTIISKLKKIVLVKNAGKVVFVITAISVGTYFLSIRDKQCMFWNGNNYEPIACGMKRGNQLILALDTFKVNNLKKIKEPDTLTYNSLGNVWYVKIKIDSVEFYTSDGIYPKDNNKRLLPVTKYIVNKYVLNKL